MGGEKGNKEKERRGRGGEEEGREGEGKGFAGPMSNYFLHAPVSDCMGIPITYSYAYVSVGTVIFDTNNHEANYFLAAV